MLIQTRSSTRGLPRVSVGSSAKATGLTYKAAWDALDAMANLFGRPLLETRTGGRSGGGASLPACA